MAYTDDTYGLSQILFELLFRYFKAEIIEISIIFFIYHHDKSLSAIIAL